MSYKDNNYDMFYHDNSNKIVNEISTLIDMAESMQKELVSKKNSITRIMLSIFIIIYLFLMSIFLFRTFTHGFSSVNYYSQLLFSSVFFLLVLIFSSAFRIKNILDEIRIERYAMQEIMEVIFNLRKVIPKNSLDVVDLTIIDLKLKRLRFY